MAKKNNGNAVLIIIAAALVIGLFLLFVARKNNQLTQQTGYQVTSDTSSATLDKDINAVDNSIKDSSDSVTNVNQGLNETPIAQPQ